MPRAKRFFTSEAKQFLLNYGYTTPPDYRYTNMNDKIRLYDLVNECYVTMSLNQVDYRVNRATFRRPTFDSEGLDRVLNIDFQPGRIALDKAARKEMYDILNDVQSQPGRVRDEDKFLASNPATLHYINHSVPRSEVEELKQSIKQQLPSTVRQLKYALNNNATTVVDVHSNQDAIKQSVLLSIQILKPMILSKNVTVYLTSVDGTQKRFYLNENSLNLLNEALFQDNIPDVNDSNTEVLTSYYIKDLASIVFEVTPKVRANRMNPGFFPFINKSPINLERYGIYNDIDSKQLTESCLITAIRESNVLSNEEFSRLQHFVKTRTFLLEQLPLICNEFNVQFNLRIVSDKGMISTRSYGKSNRIIKLIVMYHHYMIDALPNVSLKYLQSQPLTEGDTMLGAKQSMNIITLVNRLVSMNLLVPMTDDQFNSIISNFQLNDNTEYNHQRLVEIPDIKVKDNQYVTSKPKHGKFYFGYIPTDDEIDIRIQELQKVVNTLPLRHPIDVSRYYKYSTLMQKIMFECGCYDGVYESSGTENQRLRDSIQYPRPHSDYNNGAAFEINNTKLYYIDMNSSYMSFINGIPTDLSMNTRNYKINELIHTLYNLRRKYKQSNPKLATTIKFLMNSCYGYSLRKPKEYKRKYSNNISNYVSNYQNFIFAVYELEHNKGFIHSKNSFVPDYNTVQFGADVINNYNRFMDMIRSTVNVLYSNIDAILISESDYNKLQSMGLVGSELGQFHIEHVFDRFVYRSGRKWKGYFDGELVEQRGRF